MKHVGVLVIVISVLFSVNSAHSTIWYVHPDSTLNLIQTALDGCSAGDTVLVGPGIYGEHLVWPTTQGIDLISEFGPESTMIHGGHQGRTLYMSVGNQDSTTIIDGFRIRRGYATAGSGIRLNHCSPIIRNNIITDNESSSVLFCGAGIFCENGSNAIIDSNQITINLAAGYGGGIGCVASSPRIVNNYISGNKCDSAGGGIYCYQSSPYIADNQIEFDSAYWGGGIAVINSSNPAITGNIINYNCASYMGAGLYFYQNVSPTIENNDVSNNICPGVLGAGIRFSPNTSGTMKHCTIADNDGVGIAIRTASPDIDSCAVDGNGGWGIRCYDGANPTINYCDIVGNSSYAIRTSNLTTSINAEYNWWGDSTGPYHPLLNPTGQGGAVGDSVDFDPWLTEPGVEEQPIVGPVERQVTLDATIFRGPLQLPEGKKCRVFDITGRTVEPDKITRGIYFLEIDNRIVRKVVKIR